MTDGDALLAAILAEPAEDTPRLVYADYLDETGDHIRASIIRTGIAHAKHEIHAWESVWLRPAGVRRITAWGLQSVGAKWVFGVARPLAMRGLTERLRKEMPSPIWERPEFIYTRGFVGAVRLYHAEWDAMSWKLIERYPIERVIIADVGDVELESLRWRFPRLKFDRPMSYLLRL